MRRYWRIAVVVSLVAGLGSYVALAQQERQGMGGGMMGRGQGMMMQDEGSMGEMRGMMAQCMAQSMAQQSVVATTDGGVVILAAGKLMKYDGNLNLVKEIDLQIDYDAMRSRMERMVRDMPMGRRMMPGRGGMMDGADDSSQQ